MISFILLGLGSFIVGYITSFLIENKKFLKSQTDWVLGIVSDKDLYDEFIETLSDLRKEHLKHEDEN